jgi:hypothetical protein
MDIVIPLGKGGQKNDDIELRYALRSIEKYLRGYGRIFIVGEKPVWKSKGIEYLDCNDVPGLKQRSMFFKILHACNNDITDEFILWHDDHLLLKPLHVSEIKNWYHGTIEEHLYKAAGRYHQACANTKRVLDMPYVGSTGDWKYYDIHTPCIFNKAGIRDLSKLDWDMQMIIKSLYFNINKGESEEMRDCKLNRPYGKQDIEDRIKDRLFFSTGKNGLKPAMFKKFQELYPEKCSYEC